MVRIRVDPAQLRALGAQWQQTAGELRAVEGRLGAILGGLEWEVRQKAGIDAQVGQAQSQARFLADQADALARYLVTKAQAFEEADGQGVSGLGQILGAFAPVHQQWIQSSPGDRYAFPTDQAASQAQLGTLLSGKDAHSPIPTPVPTPVPKELLFTPVIGWTSLKGTIEATDKLKSILWDTTRVERRRHARTIGRLINRLVRKKHGGWVRRMEDLLGYIPVRDARRVRLPGFTDELVDVGLEFASGETHAMRDLVVAGGIVGIEYAITRAIPVVGTALWVSDLVQIGGGIVTIGLDLIGQDEWADKGRKVLEAIDADRYIRKGVEWAVDQIFQSSKAQRIQALTHFIPGVGQVVQVSDMVQATGKIGTTGLDLIGQDEWADKGREILKAIDVSRPIYEGVEDVVDGVTEGVQQWFKRIGGQ